MKSKKILIISLLLSLLIINLQSSLAQSKWEPSPAYKWLDAALAGTARDVVRNKARPTVGSRELAIVQTAIFDAWAAYDSKAVGTVFGDKLRRPKKEFTLSNKTKAISYAAYRTLIDVYPYPEDYKYYTDYMKELGYDPNDNSTDIKTPQGIGNIVAAAILEYRHHDGANQLGDEVGSNGEPYSDYTYYKSVNPPDQIKDPDCWQPIPFDNGNGGTVTPGFLTPHWYRVKPFALMSSSQFRPSIPPLVGSEQLQKEVDEIIDLNAKLDYETKAVVEFMRDGPSSTGQSGHWLRFAQDVSKRDQHNIDQDVKLYFVVANTAMDAFIASWEAKRFYDSSRPWTLVHHYYKGKEIQGWAGPGKGTASIKGEEWYPYSPRNFVTPPFPGYVSGHSSVSAACAESLRFFTGKDYFGKKEIIKAGALTEPGFEKEVILELPTFTATAEMAGISRVLGGYHIQSDNIAGLKLGRQVAKTVWEKAEEYINGTAQPLKK